MGGALGLERAQGVISAWDEIEADIRPAIQPAEETVQLELFIERLIAGEDEPEMLVCFVQSIQRARDLVLTGAARGSPRQRAPWKHKGDLAETLANPRRRHLAA